MWWVNLVLLQRKAFFFFSFKTLFCVLIVNMWLKSRSVLELGAYLPSSYSRGTVDSGWTIPKIIFYSWGTLHTLQPSRVPGYLKATKKPKSQKAKKKKNVMLAGWEPHVFWLSLKKPKPGPQREVVEWAVGVGQGGRWVGIVEQASLPSTPSQHKQPRWGKNESEHPSIYSAHLLLSG